MRGANTIEEAMIFHGAEEVSKSWKKRARCSEPKSVWNGGSWNCQSPVRVSW